MSLIWALVALYTAVTGLCIILEAGDDVSVSLIVNITVTLGARPAGLSSYIRQARFRRATLRRVNSVSASLETRDRNTERDKEWGRIVFSCCVHRNGYTRSNRPSVTGRNVTHVSIDRFVSVFNYLFIYLFMFFFIRRQILHTSRTLFPEWHRSFVNVTLHYDPRNRRILWRQL